MHRDAGTTAATDPGQTTHQAHEEPKTATNARTPDSTPRSEQGPRTDTFTGKTPECSTPNRQHRDLAREVTADQDQQPDPRPQRSPVPEGTQGTYRTARNQNRGTCQTPEDDSDNNQEEDHLLRPLTNPQVTYDNETTIANRRDQIGHNFAFTRIGKANTPVLPANHVKHWRATTAEPGDTESETKATAGSRSGHKRLRLTRLNRRRSNILIQPGMRKSPMRLANQKIREELAAAAATANQVAQDSEIHSASEAPAQTEGQRPRSPEALAAAGQGGEDREGGNTADLNSVSEASAAAEIQRPRSPVTLAVVRQGEEKEEVDIEGEPDSASEAQAATEGRRPRSPEHLATASQGGEEKEGEKTTHLDPEPKPLAEAEGQRPWSPEEPEKRAEVSQNMIKYRRKDKTKDPASKNPGAEAGPREEPLKEVTQTREAAPARPPQREGYSTQDLRHTTNQGTPTIPTACRKTMTARVIRDPAGECELDTWQLWYQPPPPLSTPAAANESETEEDAGASSDRQREDRRYNLDQRDFLNMTSREDPTSTDVTPEGAKAPATTTTTTGQQTNRNTVRIPHSQGIQGTLPQHWTKGPAPTGFTLVAHSTKDKKERLQDAAAARDPKDPRSAAYLSKARERLSSDRTRPGTTRGPRNSRIAKT